jgi:Do/DeqQ family serine protease
MKRIIGIFVIALLGAIGGAAIVNWMDEPQQSVQSINQPVQFANFPDHIIQNPNFVVASSLATPAVVHIKTKVNPKQSKQDIPDDFRSFFGRPEFFFGPQGPQTGSGSGVIISSDGYIITNNHVISGADEIEVILNDKRSFNGTIVGTDPSTDIALIKIAAESLPTLGYGNSDEIQVGEWVLAVGNPFNLTSTVTAGIVSAKARSVGILGGGSSMEAFIQTDAAVNPGNSGGALVNVKGELIGINTAIATNTGSYQGYSFAVPVNIARKVVEDIKNFGSVQRAFLGVQILEVNAELVNKESLKVNEGVYVADFLPNSAAENAGIKKGDVIVQIDNNRIKSTPELMEIVGRKRPGDKIKVQVDRSGKSELLSVTLRNADGKTSIVKKEKTDYTALLGGEFENASKGELESLKISGGVKVKKLGNGQLKDAGVREGFIITRIDRSPINSTKDLFNALEGKKGGILLEGYYPNGAKAYYGFGL